MNIFDFPFYYISFKPNKKLEYEAKQLGFTNVNHFQAIDGRKFDIDNLLKEKVITIRSYNDLKYKRTQHTGLPSKGAIGCTMSHNKLWEKCINNNFPFIIIVEDDVILPQTINSNTIDRIKKIINKDKGLFMSSNKKLDNNIFGAHFYIASIDACKELVKDTFPIDIQTDFYISHKSKVNDIHVENFEIAKQKLHKSSIQDICIKCRLPNGVSFYLIIILLAIFIIILLFLVYKGFRNYRSKFTACSSNLQHCRNNK